jgi:cell division septation protein DedD
MGGPSKRLHPDFGDSGDAMPYGIPYTVVSSSHQKVSVDFQYADESDPGPYPFGSDTPIEGGSDRHAIMIDKSACTLYELYAAHYSSGGSTAGSGAIWSLTSNKLRPAGWTSADAAGLPIFAGLVRLDEVKAGRVDHAIRVTASATDRSYLWPARHQAGAAHNANLPPMGARFRLKQSFSMSGFRSDTRVILTAMKRYGMIVADNGSDWFFTGTAENGWSNDMLDELKTIPAGAFEAVDESSLMVDRNSGRVRSVSGVATKSNPRLKASVAAKPTTPKPSASPKPTPRSTATPSQTSTATPSPAPLAAAADDRPGGRGWLVVLVAAAGAVIAGLVFVRRRLVRSRP